MKRSIEGEDRQQVTLLPECLNDDIGDDNPVRVVEVFLEELHPQTLGFEGVEPAGTGCPWWTAPGPVDKPLFLSIGGSAMSTQRFTPEFKQGAIKQVIERGYSVPDVAPLGRLGP